MMYLGIDLHARKLMTSLLEERGDVIQARQVSTRPEKVQDFLAGLTRECAAQGDEVHGGDGSLRLQ